MSKDIIIDNDAPGSTIKTLATKHYKIMTGYDGSTNVPSIIREFENDLGGTPVWSRNDVGLYYLTLAGAFKSGKTWMNPFGVHIVDPVNRASALSIPIGDTTASRIFYNVAQRYDGVTISEDIIALSLYDNDFNPVEISAMGNFTIPIDIIIYP